MSILVVRPGSLGDTILTLPIIDAISRKHPKQRIVLLGAKQFAFLMPPNVTLDSFDSVNWTWVFENDIPRSRLSSLGIDMAYVILKNCQTTVRNLEAAGVKTIHASSQPEQAKSIVETLCERLSLPVPPRKPYLDKIVEKKTARRVWVAPGSGSRKKNAPLTLFSGICNILKTLGLSEVHITLGESDAWLREENEFVEFARGLNAEILHDTQLNKIITTCSNDCIFIGNDSGASHLAAALNIPCVLFFQTTDFRVWAPWAPVKNLFILDSKKTRPHENECLRHFLTQSLNSLQLHQNTLALL